LEKNPFGSARITPNTAFAGQKGEWTIEYTVGSKGIAQGGGIRVHQPTSAHDLWPLGKVLAFCSNRRTSLEVCTENAYPQTYHHSKYPSVTVTVYGTDLKAGDRIRIVIGALGGYVSGRFVRSQAFTHSAKVCFHVYVDPKGNGGFVRERFRAQAYEPVPGDLTVDVRPAQEARLRVTLRSRPAKGKDPIGVLAVEATYENPVRDGACDVALSVVQGAADVPPQTSKPSGRDGVRFPLSDTGKGVCRVSASSWKHGIYGVSNPLSQDFFAGGYQAYFGDMHVMTGDCGNPQMSGSTETALLYARDVFGLDFTAVTNSFNPKCWKNDQRLFRKYNKAHDFVTLPAYEVGWLTGHKNIYYLDESLPGTWPKDVNAMWRFLKGKECMAIAHHPNTHSETDRELSWGPHDLSTINPKFERLIEICQNRGSFEKDEVGGEVSFGGFGSSVRDALAMGYRLGFVGGTDTHRGRPGSPLSNQSGLDARANVSGGITGVLAKELTRQAIWEALKARRCYATTSVRILLDVKLNGLAMGRDLRITRSNRAKFRRRTITVKAAGTYPLDRIVIVRNGKEVAQRRINDMDGAFEWTDDAPLSRVRDAKIRGMYYHAKVIQSGGNLAWASPIWLTF